MKKFIIFTYIILFYSLTPFYGLSSELPKPPCSNLLIKTEIGSSSEQSAHRMIQTLIEYSGETREASWIQRTIPLMKERTRVPYPDPTEMQAILQFLEEKIGGKQQLLKVLKLSPSFLIHLRENSLNTHLRPLFKFLEDTFGQDTVLNKLKQSLKMIQLEIDKTKQIIDILQGRTPIPIFEDQRVFEIKLNFNNAEIRNLFIKNLNIYSTPLKNFTGSTSLETGEYQKGTIQTLWPFIKANLITKETNLLHLKSDIDSTTTKAIEKLLLQSSEFLRLNPTTIAELFDVLTGKEKPLVTLNNKPTLLNLGFKDDEIGQLILERQIKFLRNNRKKLIPNIEILWPLIEALKRKDLELQNDTGIHQDYTINKALAIKNFFAQAPQGFTKKPTSLNDLIEILTGKKSISFQSDGETITFELDFELHKIAELLLRDAQGFSQLSQQRLEFTIKTLWPFIAAFAEENLKSQRGTSEISQEDIINETIKIIKGALLQSVQGFSPNIEFFEKLMEALTGKTTISFQSDGETITFKLDFEPHKIGSSFSRDPQGFSQMNQQDLKSTIKTLWPFIAAFAEENLKSQRGTSEISQEDIINETIKIIKTTILQSTKAFSATPGHLTILTNILEGKKSISFQSDGETITFELDFEPHKIGSLFSRDPQGFSQLSQQRLEFTIKTLWPFIAAFAEENLKSQRGTSEISQEDIINETIKIIKGAFLQSVQGFSPNTKFFISLVKILKGEEAISFQYGGQTITLTIKLGDREIAELFLDNPQGFSKKGGKNLEKVFQDLWSNLEGDIKAIRENYLNQTHNLKLIIRRAFSN